MGEKVRIWLLLCLLLCLAVERVISRETLAQRQAEWRRTVTTSQPAHWYEFEVDSIKDGAPDSASTSSPLNGVYSGNVIVAKQGIVGHAVAICGGRSAVLLSSP